jgi:hypothetical protein
MESLILYVARFELLWTSAALVAGVLWIGALFGASWLCSRARLMADGPEVGGLAMVLHSRWATRCLALTAAAGLLALAGSPEGAIHLGQACGVLVAVGVLFAIHARVGARAARIARGNLRGTRGEIGHRLALILSLALLAGVVTFRTDLFHW